MRILKDIANTKQPDAEYLKGNIRNKDTGGGITGTPVIEEVYGDIIQLFQKLTGLASIVENDLPDNETNGFQLIAALDFNIEAVARTLSATTVLKGVVEKSTAAELAAGTPEKYPDAALLAPYITTIKKAYFLDDWNMQTTPFIDIAHGLDYKKILNAWAVIITDADVVGVNSINKDILLGGTIGLISTTTYRIERTGSGVFDSVDYNSLSNNRGWLIVEYINE